HHASRDAFGRAIVSSIQGKAVRSPQYSGDPTREDIELTHQAHARVAAAVLDGDGDAAAEAMREHITSSWARRRPADAPDA
ncbi:FCD domain-containing protein, partial [Streptomyces violaceoruber]